VSNSSLVFSEAEPRAEQIVEFSRVWNSSVGITGALVFTELRFVQFIEGPEAAITDLMMKLRRDARHTQIDVIEDSHTSERLFDRWSLAYSGPDAFIDRDLRLMLRSPTPASRPVMAARLKAHLRAMANIA
jgi:hypothetical protein